MGDESSDTPPIRCLKCDFEAPIDADEWEVAEHPALGQVEQCPECGSKNTTGLSRK